MEQYIPKSVVLAEIERRIKYDEMVMDHDAQITELLSRELNTLYKLLSFIKSLEVIEVDLGKEIDLDAAIDAYMDKNFGEPWDGARPVGSFELATMAEYFFKLGLNVAQKGK